MKPRQDNFTTALEVWSLVHEEIQVTVTSICCFFFRQEIVGHIKPVSTLLWRILWIPRQHICSKARDEIIQKLCVTDMTAEIEFLQKRKDHILADSIQVDC